MPEEVKSLQVKHCTVSSMQGEVDLVFSALDSGPAREIEPKLNEAIRITKHVIDYTMLPECQEHVEEEATRTKIKLDKSELASHLHELTADYKMTQAWLSDSTEANHTLLNIWNTSVSIMLTKNQTNTAFVKTLDRCQPLIKT